MMGKRWEKGKKWYPTKFNSRGITKWNWMCQYHENLIEDAYIDIGAFTYINAKYGVEIQEGVQIGSHCSIYSWSSIDDKGGKVTIRRNARIGSHSLIMPGVTVGENAVIGAFSFVNRSIPANEVWAGTPVKFLRALSDNKEEE